jgi:dephospho-CoA kinase
MVVRIGITGGIASGKSKCLKFIAENYKNIYTINLDEFAFRVYERNPIVIRSMQAIFGKEILTATGQVDRKVLASRVFKSPEDLRCLTDITGP